VRGSNQACPEGYPVKAPEQGCLLDQGRGSFVVLIFVLGASPLGLQLSKLPATPFHHYAPAFLPTLGQSVQVSGKNPNSSEQGWPYAFPRVSEAVIAPCEQGSPPPLLS